MSRYSVTLVEALDHARGREIERSTSDIKGSQTVWFTDGSIVRVEHRDAHQYSEYTWDSSSTIISIQEPKP